MACLERTRLTLDEHIGLAEASQIVARSVRAWRSQYRSGMPEWAAATNCLKGMVTTIRVMTNDARDLMIEPYSLALSTLASRSRKHDEPQESDELRDLLLEYLALCRTLLTRYSGWSLQRRAYCDLGRPDWAGLDLLPGIYELLRTLAASPIEVNTIDLNEIEGDAIGEVEQCSEEEITG